MHPCVNLQKKHTRLSGFMVEVCGDAGLKTLDTPTEQIFRGITVVKCVLSELESIELLAKQDTLQKKLDVFMTDMDAPIEITFYQMEVSPENQPAHLCLWDRHRCENTI